MAALQPPAIGIRPIPSESSGQIRLRSKALLELPSSHAHFQVDPFDRRWENGAAERNLNRVSRLSSLGAIATIVEREGYPSKVHPLGFDLVLILNAAVSR